MQINTLTKQELNAISAYLIHDKRDKSVTFNHKQMADLGLKLFNEVNNVDWDKEPVKAYSNTSCRLNRNPKDCSIFTVGNLGCNLCGLKN